MFCLYLAETSHAPRSLCKITQGHGLADGDGSASLRVLFNIHAGRVNLWQIQRKVRDVTKA